MDTKSNREKRRTAKIPTQKRGTKNNAVRVEKSRAFKESDYKEKSSVSGNTKEDAQKKVKGIYEPLKHQIRVLIEYINILETKVDGEQEREIALLIDFIGAIKNWCDTYLSYELIKAGKKHG